MMSRHHLPRPRIFCAWLCLLVCSSLAAADKDADETVANKKKPKSVAKEEEKDTKKPATKKKKEEAPPKKSTTKPGDGDENKKPAKTKDEPTDVTDQKAGREKDGEGIESSSDGEFDKPSGGDKAADEARKKNTEAKSASTGKKEEGKTGGGSMAGWNMVHYQDRDYVTGDSIHRFYRFADHKIDGSTVWFTSPVLIMKGQIGSQDLLINNIKFVLSHPIEESNGKILISRLDLCKLIDPVLRPSYINTASVFDTVVVDAGHGGHDSGARGIYGYEKDFALQLAALLKADLEKRGLKVVLTRKDDTFISLGGRVEIANQIPKCIYVSLHFNSGGSAATGIETYALSPQGAASDYGARGVDSLAFNGNQRDSENIALATAIHASVVHHFKLVDRGVKRARWYVLKGLERPGVLFEGGFVTNSGDGRLIAAANFRTELAHTIGDAIMNYRRALQPPQH
jgi:N-acetylmuramoyl-L-alanine amidase